MLKCKQANRYTNRSTESSGKFNLTHTVLYVHILHYHGIRVDTQNNRPNFVTTTKVVDYNHQVSYKPIILMAFDRYLSPDNDDDDNGLTPEALSEREKSM